MSYLLPLGPFDQDYRGPQRVVLHVDGEHVTSVDYQGGFHARNCTAQLQHTLLAHCYPLVNRVCGVHSHHHALAWTMALEQLAGIEALPRAQVLRVLVAETERIASHLYDVCRIVALLGLQTHFQQLRELRESALEAATTLTGQRLIYDFVRPGGVEHDLLKDERVTLDTLLAMIAHRLRRLIRSLLNRGGLKHRTHGVGQLSRDLFASLDCVGWLARASGLDVDVRRDQPYGAYALGHPPVVLEGAGDVRARLLTLLAEAFESADFARQLLAELPAGRWRGDLVEALPPGVATVSVEAPSGALTYHLVSDGSALTEITIASAQQVYPTLLPTALAGALVDDAALVVASLAPCTACAET